MNGKLSAALAAAAVLALAGCSSPASSSASSAPAAATTTTSAPTGFLTIEQVAHRAGCSEYTEETSVGAKDGAMCTVGGHDLYMYTFADDSARDNWMKIAKAAGALGSFETGTSWVVQTL